MPARGIVLAAALALGAGNLASPPPAAAPPPPDPARALAVLRAQDFGPLLDAAGRRVQAYFDDARQAAFVEELFSLKGKWKAATRGQASYEKSVRRAFERHVYRPDDFRARVVDAVREDLAFAVRAAENRVLVAVLDDLRARSPSLAFDVLRAEHARLVADLAPLVARDLGMNVVSIAAGEAAVSLFSAACAGAGLASGPWTFGAGLLAGLAAGIAVDATAGAACEDAARARVRTDVNALRNRLLSDLDDALAKALRGWRRAQEAAITDLYRGDRHAGLAHR